MATQKIQIADKPTLDTVAENVTEIKESTAKQTSVEELVAEVETLKTEIASLQETLASVESSVGGYYITSVRLTLSANTAGKGDTVKISGNGKIQAYLNQVNTGTFCLKPTINCGSFEVREANYIKDNVLDAPFSGYVTITNSSSFTSTANTYCDFTVISKEVPTITVTGSWTTNVCTKEISAC